MPALKKVIVGSGYAIGATGYIIIGIGGVVIHLWTILIAFGNSGFISALITLVTPIVSELYWAFRVLGFTGTAFNVYWLAMAIYIFAWIVLFVIYSIGERITNK